eukprot:gene3815-6325_t
METVTSPPEVVCNELPSGERTHVLFGHLHMAEKRMLSAFWQQEQQSPAVLVVSRCREAGGLYMVAELLAVGCSWLLEK